MIIADFIKDLKDKGISLRNENGALRFSAVEGALTEQVRAQIKAGKPEILAWLGGEKDAAQIFHDCETPHELFPLSPIQQAYLIGRDPAFELGGNAAHAYTELETVGLDTDKFARAWQATIAAHDALRTQFNADNTQQVLQSVPENPIAEIDLRNATQKDLRQQLTELRNRRSYRSGDIHQWPQYDIVIALLPKDRFRISISFDLMVADALSGELMLSELIARYHDITPNVPALTFRDVRTSETSLNVEQERQDRSYWQDKTSSIPPHPELPQIAAFDQITSPKYQRFDFSVDPETLENLSNRARHRGLTANSVLLTAFAEILSRWSANEDLSLGVTLFNRPSWHPHINQIIGEFTNTTLASYDALPSTFAERANAVQGSLWDGIHHSAISGVEVMRMLPKTRPTQAAAPYIFTSLLDAPIDDNVLETIPEKDRQTFEEVFAISQTPQVAIDHQIYLRGGKVRFIWDVVCGAFPDGMIATMLNAYQTLILDLASHDAIWQSARPVPEDSAALETRQALNDTAATVTDACLHHGFLAQAKSQPDAIAVVDDAGTFSYGALGQWANILAADLQANGVVRGDRVAIACPKGAEQIAGVLAIHLCGAVYVPLSWENPPDRDKKILEDCAARAVIVSERAPASNLCDDVSQVIAKRPSVKTKPAGKISPVACDPDDLAYIIFTSGSTGRPKGVALSHRAALNTILDVNAQHKLGQNDCVYGISSLSFDLSVYDIFGALTAGAKLVLPSEEARKAPETWTQDVQRHGVTVWNSAPALAELLVDRAANNQDDLSTLKAVLLSGDWIPLSLPGKLKSAAPKARIMGMGGATEAAIWSTCSEIELPLDPKWRSIPYGAPMINQGYHVLNRRLDHRPDYVVGDLYLTGIGLAHEYWGDRDKTNAAFITHSETGERLYKTGDRARFWPDGRLEFLGRQDNQVKIGGHRIELGEISTALAEAQGVLNASVQVVPLNGLPYLVGIIATGPQSEPCDTDMLERHLQQHLPTYMIPHHFVTLDSIPLSTNGKVDQKALQAICLESLSRSIKQVAPRNGFEELLAEIWSEVLDLESVGVTDDFFTIGGDSLKAIRLSNRIQAEFDLNLTIGQFLTAPTIAKQAEMIMAEMEASMSDEELEVVH